jgi:hypothetical protein
MGETGDIIVKGGSVEITFDTTALTKDNNDPQKHSHGSMKMTRVRVLSESEEYLYDSDTDGRVPKGQNGLKLEVRISTVPERPGK